MDVVHEFPLESQGLSNQKNVRNQILYLEMITI